jgi:hypothetical protein
MEKRREKEKRHYAPTEVLKNPAGLIGQVGANLVPQNGGAHRVKVDRDVAHVPGRERSRELCFPKMAMQHLAADFRLIHRLRRREAAEFLEG